MSESSSASPTLDARVLALLTEVAPDVDPAAVRPELPFRDQFDFDSMDFLNFATALHRHFGVDIPERDYRELTSLDSCVAYLRRKSRDAEVG
jgi:acyl carrier protein